MSVHARPCPELVKAYERPCVELVNGGEVLMTTYLSVCSGIEAATVAWHDLGWQPVGFAEIEPFPSAVLAHHYPDVPNHGDMMALPARILSQEIGAPDILCGGTPCQAFSVAGLRQSLSDDRGNLSLTFCEIANAIDTIRARRGESAGIVFWENVPGVLNTSDNAFGCFLGALAGEDGALEPPRGRWKNAGCVFGPQRAVAWRVLDAQYFGVAQRRRRVFVIASARDGFNPAEVLFEFDGVRRDLAPSREAGEKVAPCVTNGPPFSRTGNERVECDAIVPVGNVQGGDVTTLSSREYKGLSCGRDGMTSAAVIHTAPIALQDVSGRDKAQNGKGWSDEGTSYTLDAAATQGVAQPIPLDLRNATRDPEKHDAINRQGVGVGDAGDPAYTVTTACVHGVAQPMIFQQNTRDEVRYMGGDSQIAGALMAEPGMKQQNYVAQPVSYAIQGNMIGRSDTAGPQGAGINEEICFTQNATDVHGVAQPIHIVNGNSTPETATEMAFPLRADDGSGNRQALQHDMAVRRLTVTECERLQGFPDGYTNIPWRKKDAQDCPDGPRYKALGNSWAVPVVKWLGSRIAKQC